MWTTVCLSAQRKDEGAVVEYPFLRVRTRHKYVLHQEDTRPDSSWRSRGLERRAVDALFRYLFTKHCSSLAVMQLGVSDMQHSGICLMKPCRSESVMPSSAHSAWIIKPNMASVGSVQHLFSARLGNACACVCLCRSCKRHGYSPWILHRACWAVCGHKHTGYRWDRERLAPLSARAPRLPEWHRNLRST